MNVSDAIRTRQSVKVFKDTEPLSKETISELLEAATWAPNHHHTEPWKFFVLTGDGRYALSNVMKEWAYHRSDDPESEKEQKRIEKISQKPLIAPTIIIAALSPNPENKKAIYIEDVCATSAAIQNILLEAHSKGIGAIWKSGPAYYAEVVKDFFKLRNDEEILGAIFLGESDMKKEVKRKRIPFEEKTVWITEEDGEV